jgi:cysteine desulfurase
MNHVYFDHNATTKLDSEVLAAMMPWLDSQSGNPTSRHQYGRNARDAVELARNQVADACGAYPSQIVFTANGTEANNFAIKGMASHVANGQLLTSAIEHPCVTNPARMMQFFGHSHQQITVNAEGEVDLATLEQLLQKPTSLVSVMAANNETGVIQDIAAIVKIARKAGALVHTDAVQMLSKVALDFDALSVQAMTISSHKINGPQGAAALVLDKRIDITPLLHGGGQEKGLRSGTENVAAIVGFGAACALANKRIKTQTGKIKRLRDQFEQGLVELSKDLNITIFSQAANRLPNTTFFAISGIEGETLVMALDRKGYAVASGSACSSDSTEPSHVLLAMGVDPDLARGAVRVSFGADNTQEQVANFTKTLASEITRLKQLTAIAA